MEPHCDRTDIPNFIHQYVQLKGLKNTSMNNKAGKVVDWNEERERFAVRMIPGAL